MDIDVVKLSLLMAYSGIDTAKQLAGLSGVSENTISRIKNGGTAKISTVVRLSEALGCDPKELVKGVSA